MGLEVGKNIPANDNRVNNYFNQGGERKSKRVGELTMGRSYLTTLIFFAHKSASAAGPHDGGGPVNHEATKAPRPGSAGFGGRG